MKPLAVMMVLSVALSSARAEVTSEKDLRLLQRVDVSASSVTLQGLAEDLSRRTGVEIRAGATENDWRVRERRVHVALNRLPLGAALRSIAGATGYRIRRSGKAGEWAYRIWQPAADREAEDALRRSRQTEEERKDRAMIQSAFDGADEAASEDPEDALRQKDSDPWKAFLGGTEGGRAYAQLLRSLPPDTRDAIMQGHKAMLDLADLSPEVRRQLQDLVPQKVRDQILASMGPEKDVFQQLVPAHVVFQPLSEEADGEQQRAIGGLATIAVLGEPEAPSEAFEQMAAGNPLGRGVPMAMLPLASGDSPLGRTFGRAMLRMEAGDNPRDVFAAMQGEMDAASNGGGTENDPAEPTPLPTDPRLLKAVDPLTIRSDDAGEPVSAQILRQLKEKTKLSYVLEYYPDDRERRIAIPRETAPLYKVLDAMKAAGYGWELNGDGVRIRPDDWVLRRFDDVPESFMERYRRFLKGGGAPDLDTLADVAAALTDGQIRHRFLFDPVLKAFTPGLTSHVSGNRALLRLYATLSATQKARMQTSEGLPFPEMDSQGKTQLAGFLEDETSETGVAAGSIALKIDPEAPVPAAPDGKDAGKTSTEASPPPMAVGDRKAVFTLTLSGGEGRKPLTLERTVELPGSVEIRKLWAVEPPADGKAGGKGAGL